MKTAYNYLLSAFVILTASTGNALAQPKFIKKLLSNTKDTTRSSSFIPLPAIGYAQETGFEFGVVALYSFYTDRKDTLTRNSSISGSGSLTTKKQSYFKVVADVWSPQNKLHYLGDIRYRNFPFYFYGIGNETNDASKDLVVQKFFRVGGELEKKLLKYYYGGVNLAFENYIFSDKESGGLFSDPIASIPSRKGGKVLFAGISQVIDTRNTNTYTTKGAYLKVNYSFAPDIFGGENFSGSQLKADLRGFESIGKKLVIAGQLNYQALYGDQKPFYLLPQLGNDQVMRGYYTGRYRDSELYAAQGELRYRFIPRLGVAVFGGAGAVTPGKFPAISALNPFYGVGTRYFFDIERGLSLRLDYAMAEKRANEKRQKGFYISFGEAF